jgi:PAS domain S-box-containing protein
MFQLKRTRAENAWPQLEEQQEFLDTIGAAVLIVTSDREIFYANQAAKEKWGTPAGEPCYKVMKGSRETCPDCPLDGVIETRGMATRRTRMPSPEGWHDYENLYLFVGADPKRQRSYVAIVSHDLDEKKTMELELRKEKGFSRALLESMNAIVLGLDQAGEVVFANRAAEEISGYSEEEIRTAGMGIAAPEGSLQPGEGYFEPMFQEGGHKPVLIPLVSKSGEHRMISWTYSPLETDGEIEGAIALGQDVTERFTHRKEVEKRAQELEVVNAILSKEGTPATEEEFLRFALDSLLALPGYRCGAVYVLEERGTSARLIVSKGYRRSRLPESITETRNDFPASCVYSRSVEFADESSQTHPGIKTMLAEEGLSSAAAVAMTPGGHPVGIAILCSDLDMRGIMSGRDMLRATAEALDLVAENAFLRHRAEERAREATALLRISQGLAGKIDLGEALAKVVEEAVRLLEVDACIVYLYEGETGDMHRKAAVSSGPPLESSRESFHISMNKVAEDAAKTLRTQVIEDTATDPRVPGYVVEEMGIKSALSVPLADEGRFTGMIFLGVSSRHRTFTDREVELMESFAGQAATALHTASLVDRIRDSEEKYRALIENSLIGVFVHDGKDLLLVNDRALEICGYEREEMTSVARVLEMVVPEDRGRVLESIEGPFAGDDVPAVYDVRINRKDGSRAVLQLMNNLISLGGGPVVMVTVNDITERVAAENAVRESEEKYRTLVESSQDAILILDAAGQILFANQVCSEIWGMPLEEVVGRNALKYIHPDEVERIGELYGSSWAEGKRHDRIPVQILSDGRELLFEVTAVPLRGVEGDAQIMVIATDVTDRELGARQLKESEEKYRTIVEKSRDAIILSNRLGEVIYANPSIEDVFGLSPEEARGTNLFDNIDPEDRERVAADFLNDWKTGRTVPNYPIKCMKKDGTTVNVEATSGLVGWPAEDAVQIFVVRDVTERFRREAERDARLKYEEALAAVAPIFVDPRDVDESIAEAIELTARLLGVDRSYYFELSPDGVTIAGAREWVAPGVPHLRGQLDNLNLAEFPWMLERLKGGHELVYPDIRQIPSDPERRLAENLGVKATAMVPVFQGEELAGGIGYDSIGDMREWSVSEIDLLHEMANTVSHALERRKWVDDLRKSETFRTMITENVGEGLFVVRNGIVTWLNQQAADIYGYEPEEVLGRTCEYLFADPARMESYVWEVLEGFAREGRYVSEESARRKDGETRYILTTAAPLGSGERYGELVLAVSDVTDSKRTREEAAAAADAYSTLFSTAGDGLLVHTLDGHIRDANERASLYTGYSHHELVTMNVTDLVPDRLVPLFADRRREIETNGFSGFELGMKRKDGASMPIEVASKLTSIWNERVVISSLRDITARTRAQRETRRRAAQLGSLNEVVKAATSSLEVDNVICSVVNVAVRVAGADHGAIVIEMAPGRGSGQVYASVDCSVEYIEMLGREQIQKALMDAVKPTGTSFICDVEEMERSPANAELGEALRERGIQGALVVPLTSGEKVLGVMLLASDRKGSFDTRDRDFYDAAGGEIGVAVENALIYHELTAEHERLVLLYRSAQNISGQVELESLLSTTAVEAARAVGAESALVGLVDVEREEFRWSASYRVDMKSIEGKRLRIDQGVGGACLQSKRAVVLQYGDTIPREYAQDPIFRALNVESIIAVPLISGDVVVGVLGVHNPRRGAKIGSEDVLLLEAMGRQAGVAIEKARLYEETKLHLEELEKAHEELMTLDRMKSDFVSTVSHELRSPLAVIGGFAKTLVEHFDQIDRDTEKESIEIILKKSIALEGLIENILDMSRIEDGRLEINAEAVDVVALCERVRVDQDRVAETHDVVLETSSDSIIAVADPEKTEIALGNLVRNAVKFSPEGGFITISALENGNTVEITVRDHGIGIPDDELDRIFDRFYQVDRGETRSFPGSGLGLHITKELISAMGGSVSVESKVGEGSTFMLTLPLTR